MLYNINELTLNPIGDVDLFYSPYDALLNSKSGFPGIIVYCLSYAIFFQAILFLYPG